MTDRIRLKGKRQVIDSDGYRANVGIILSNDEGAVLWARRMVQDAWQFPQGGINPGEDAEQAMYRELWEEVGLEAGDVRVLAATDSWLRYKLPRRMVRHHSQPVCIGQKQKWFALRFDGADDEIDISGIGHAAEFDLWRWEKLERLPELVIPFKRKVYEQVAEAFRDLARPA